MAMLEDISYGIEDGRIVVKPANETKRARSFWGMHRTLVQHLVTGVTEGFSKTLEITGVDSRAAAQGQNLRLPPAYRQEVNIAVPDGMGVTRLAQPKAAHCGK